MKKLALTAVVVVAAAIQANALDVTLAPSGEVRFGGDESPLRPRVAASPRVATEPLRNDGASPSKQNKQNKKQKQGEKR